MKTQISISEAIHQLLAITERLQEQFPEKKFTLDGRLVGDLGEILAKQHYEISLFEGLAKHHDGATADGRKVQIKSTMKENLTFPNDHVPDYYLGLKINHDGSFEEIFNGPGKVAAKSIANRGHSKTNLHSVSIGRLRKLNEEVDDLSRIPRKAK